MKALSIKEPWASMIRGGQKTIETRTWATDHRGPLLLCASKKPAGPLSGMAFATCNLVAIREMEELDEAAACCEIYRNAYSWVLEDVTPIESFPVRGRLGLFEVDMEDKCNG